MPLSSLEGFDLTLTEQTDIADVTFRYSRRTDTLFLMLVKERAPFTTRKNACSGTTVCLTLKRTGPMKEDYWPPLSPKQSLTNVNRISMAIWRRLKSWPPPAALLMPWLKSAR